MESLPKIKKFELDLRTTEKVKINTHTHNFNFDPFLLLVVSENFCPNYANEHFMLFLLLCSSEDKSSFISRV